MSNPSIFVPATRPVFNVDYSDLEDFVAEKYGVPSFEITEMNNDSTIACDTEMKYFDATDEASTRDLIKQGWCREWEVNSIIKVLFKDGHILDGDYIVDVCW